MRLSSVRRTVRILCLWRPKRVGSRAHAIVACAADGSSRFSGETRSVTAASDSFVSFRIGIGRRNVRREVRAHAVAPVTQYSSGSIGPLRDRLTPSGTRRTSISAVPRFACLFVYLSFPAAAPARVYTQRGPLCDACWDINRTRACVRPVAIAFFLWLVLYSAAFVSVSFCCFCRVVYWRLSPVTCRWNLTRQFCALARFTAYSFVSFVFKQQIKRVYFQEKRTILFRRPSWISFSYSRFTSRWLVLWGVCVYQFAFIRERTARLKSLCIVVRASMPEDVEATCDLRVRRVVLISTSTNGKGVAFAKVCSMVDSWLAG